MFGQVLTDGSLPAGSHLVAASAEADDGPPAVELQLNGPVVQFTLELTAVASIGGGSGVIVHRMPPVTGVECGITLDLQVSIVVPVVVSFQGEEAVVQHLPDPLLIAVGGSRAKHTGRHREVVARDDIAGSVPVVSRGRQTRSP